MSEIVLFTSLFGSKLYGTDTPESDTDYKAVYLPSVKQLLRGREIKNSVSSTGSDFAKNGADDEDFEMVPVQVFMRDFVAGQSYAYELAFNALQTPDDEVNLQFKAMCRSLVDNYLTANVKAMTGYALNQAQKYGVKGTRLNTLLVFNEVLSKHYDANFNKRIGDVEQLVDDIDYLTWQDSLIERVTYHGPKTRDPANLVDPAFTVLGKVFGFEITVADATARVGTMLKKYGVRAYEAQAAKGADWKAISHALRVIDQAIDLLDNHKLVFPLPLCDFYRDVKRGFYTWEHVAEIIEQRLLELEKAKERTSLPQHTPELVNSFYKWNDEWLDEMYFPSFDD